MKMDAHHAMHDVLAEIEELGSEVIALLGALDIFLPEEAEVEGKEPQERLSRPTTCFDEMIACSRDQQRRIRRLTKLLRMGRSGIEPLDKGPRTVEGGRANVALAL